MFRSNRPGPRPFRKPFNVFSFAGHDCKRPAGYKQGIVNAVHSSLHCCLNAWAAGGPRSSGTSIVRPPNWAPWRRTSKVPVRSPSWIQPAWLPRGHDRFLRRRVFERGWAIGRNRRLISIRCVGCRQPKPRRGGLDDGGRSVGCEKVRLRAECFWSKPARKWSVNVTRAGQAHCVAR